MRYALCQHASLIVFHSNMDCHREYRLAFLASSLHADAEVADEMGLLPQIHLDTHRHLLAGSHEPIWQFDPQAIATRRDLGYFHRNHTPICQPKRA